MTSEQSAERAEAARARRAARLRDARRAMIVEAARAVFDRVGLDGATLRVIAREAGCTTGAIYPYFDGKEAIYAAVLGETLVSLREAIARAAEAEADPRRAAAAGVLAFFDYYAARPAELTLGLYLLDRETPRRLGQNHDRALNRQLLDALAPIEAAFRAAGEEDPPAALAGATAQAVGLLILERTGRLKLWRQTGRALLERSLGLSPSPGAAAG